MARKEFTIDRAKGRRIRDIIRKELREGRSSNARDVIAELTPEEKRGKETEDRIEKILQRHDLILTFERMPKYNPEFDFLAKARGPQGEEIEIEVEVKSSSGGSFKYLNKIKRKYNLHGKGELDNWFKSKGRIMIVGEQSYDQIINEIANRVEAIMEFRKQRGDEDRTDDCQTEQ